MKALLLTVVIVVGLYVASNYIDIMTPYWQQQAALNLIDKQNALHEAAQRRQAYTDALRAVLSYVPLLILVIVGVGVWTVYHRRIEASRRAVNGSFALQVRERNGVWLVVDPNKQMFGTIAQTQDGRVLTDAERVGPDRQLEYARTIERTHQTRALADGGGFKYAAFGKLLGGVYDRIAGRPSTTTDRLLETAQPDEVQQSKMLTLNEAWNASKPDEWVLGQSPDDGELFKLRPADTAHFGIIGATGTGKTAYAALLLVANALASGWRVVVLDGKGGADWSKYGAWVEYHALDVSNVGTFLNGLFARHSARQNKLNAAGANNIWQLPKEQPIQPVLIIVDEFGYVMDNLHRTNPQEYEDVCQTLGDLLRLSRSTGIYFVPCDQNPSRWPSTMKSNLPMNITFKTGGRVAAGVNVHNAHKLERKGQFTVDGSVYNGWPAYEHIDDILKSIQPRKPARLFLTVDDSDCKKAANSMQISQDGTDAELQIFGKNHASSMQIYENSQSDAQNELSAQKLTQNLQLALEVQPTLEAQPQLVGSTPQLEGKPRSSAEWALVLEAYDRSGRDVYRTAMQVWGKLNKRQSEWIQEALERVGRTQ